MKNLKTLIVLLFVSSVFSCEVEEYLDKEVPLANAEFGKPTGVEDISSILFGTYWQMMIGRGESGFNQPITIYMEWNSTASDAFTVTDQLTDSYQNFGNGYFFYNRLRDHFEENDIEDMYEICYTLISNLNESVELIENPTLELTTNIEEDESFYNQLVGETYALRAYNYFLVSQVYGPKYQPQASNDVPSIIIKTQNSAIFDDIFDGRATLQEVYDLMISDLTIAADHISSTKLVGRFNKGAVYGLLARIHLDMNDWEKARDYADLAISEGFELEDRPIDAFNHTDNSISKEVILEFQNSNGHNWVGQRHVEFASSNSPIRLSRWNWVERFTMGRRDVLGKTYSADNIGMRTFAISHSVMREIGWMQQNSTNLTTDAQNDLRFQQIYHWAPGGTDTRMAPVVQQVPQENFLWVYKDARSANDNTLDGNDFTFENYDPRAHLPIIRVSEMYLTRAISNLKLGDEASARNDLNLVKEARWDTSAGTFTSFNGSGNDLEMEIKNERAKELLGEGDRLFYLKAMQYDVPVGDSERRGSAAVSNVPYPYADLYWELPPSEVNANPNID